MALSVEQDGLTYCIERTRAGSGERMDALLRQDSDGWYVDEVTPGRRPRRCWGVRIGRRKSWTRALAEALELIEAELVRRES